jgi:lipid A 3-O-deacylase
MRGWFGRAVFAASLVASILGGSSGARAEFGGYVAGGLGAFDFDHNDTAAEGRLEFRFSQSLFFIKPLIGTYVTEKGSIYSYFGLRAEIPLGGRFMLIPMAAVGDYEKGRGKNLGSHVEFKTGAELDVIFDSGVRLGPVFDHVSNAGLTKRNPGEENVLLMVSVPLGIITGAGR